MFCPLKSRYGLLSKIIKSFKELVETINKLAKEKNTKWLIHYLNTYLDNIHNTMTRLEYTYRIQRVLVQYNIYLSEDLVVKMIRGELE